MRVGLQLVDGGWWLWWSAVTCMASWRRPDGHCKRRGHQHDLPFAPIHREVSLERHDDSNRSLNDRNHVPAASIQHASIVANHERVEIVGSLLGRNR